MWFSPLVFLVVNSRVYAGGCMQGKEAIILTRQPGESIIIELPTGEWITVTVLGVKGNQVRIGADAPDDVSILREELLQSDTA